MLSRMCVRSGSDVLPLYRALSSSSIALSKKRAQKHHGKERRKKVLIPSEFTSQLTKWTDLLALEIESANEGMREEALAEAESGGASLRAAGACGPLKIDAEQHDALDGHVMRLRAVDARGFGRRSEVKKSQPVQLCAYKKGEYALAEAVVKEMGNRHVVVRLLRKFTTWFDHDRQYQLQRATSTGSTNKLRELIKEMKAAGKDLADDHNLVKYAYRGLAMPNVHHDLRMNLMQELDASQHRAVNAAMNAQRPFVCIHGPPGTGKTKVLVEVIMQAARQNKKVLVVAPSHAAINNITERLVQMNVDCAQGEELDEEMREHDAYVNLDEVVQKLNNPDVGGSSNLEDKAYRMKKKILKSVYGKKSVILCTLQSAVVRRLAQFAWQHDMLIIDEAAQCIEPAAWVAITNAKRVVLAGDPKQLPATLHSEQAEASGLSVSLMERLCTEFKNNNITHMLETQYRMNESIMAWSSEEFYEGRLKAAEACKHIRLSDKYCVERCSLWDEPLLFIDTRQERGDMWRESVRERSYANSGEANAVVAYVSRLIGAGVHQNDIGVVSPYAAQVVLIRNLLERTAPDVTVSSVDGFQGQEKECIVFSVCRNNPSGHVGFVKDERRLNVAVTRAKRQLVMMGSSSMMERGKNKILASLMSTVRKEGRVVSIQKSGLVD